MDRLMPKGENEKVIELMKDKLDTKIVTNFVGLRAKTYSYLTHDGNKDKKATGAKEYVIKKNLSLKIIKTV